MQHFLLAALGPLEDKPFNLPFKPDNKGYGVTGLLVQSGAATGQRDSGLPQAAPSFTVR